MCRDPCFFQNPWSIHSQMPKGTCTFYLGERSLLFWSRLSVNSDFKCSKCVKVLVKARWMVVCVCVCKMKHWWLNMWLLNQLRSHRWRCLSRLHASRSAEKPGRNTNTAIVRWVEESFLPCCTSIRFRLRSHNKVFTVTGLEEQLTDSGFYFLLAQCHEKWQWWKCLQVKGYFQSR